MATSLKHNIFHISTFLDIHIFKMFDTTGHQTFSIFLFFLKHLLDPKRLAYLRVFMKKEFKVVDSWKFWKSQKLKNKEIENTEVWKEKQILPSQKYFENYWLFVDYLWTLRGSESIGSSHLFFGKTKNNILDSWYLWEIWKLKIKLLRIPKYESTRNSY